MSWARLFALSVPIGFVAVLANAAYDRYLPVLSLRSLTPDIAVTEQLTPKSVPAMYIRGFATIIDLRPDGEAADQPSSAEMAAAVQGWRMAFAYVPVPHGDVPDPTVAALASAIATSPRPILLYCRSGRRAARAWSLVEASRPDGMEATDILAAVQAAGQSADDLRQAISQRISYRTQVPGAPQ